MEDGKRAPRAVGRSGALGLAVAAVLGLSACAGTGRPTEGVSVREGRNTSTPSGGLVPGQWPHGF